MVHLKKAVVVLCIVGAVAPNPWVRRKKKDEEIGSIRPDDDEVVEGGAMDELLKGDFLKGIGESGMFEDMLSGLMDTPEMKEIMENPEKLREAIRDNPLLKSVPGADAQIEQLLDSDAFKDPEVLKSAMKVGMEAFKNIGEEFTKAIEDQMDLLSNDPEAFEKQMLDALENFAGDPELAKHIPGLDQISPEKMSQQLEQLQKMMQQEQQEQQQQEVLPDGTLY